MCQISGCQNENIIARGLCTTHYGRLRRCGDANASVKQLKPSRNPDDPRSFRIIPETNCMEWLGYKDSDGYARKFIDGKVRRLGRIFLKRKLGREIRKGKLALHTCGNRACLNPDHLYEGTPSQNMLDRREDGTIPVGDKASQSKLSGQQVISIKMALAAGTMIKSLIGIYPVSRSQLYRIRGGENWGHLRP